MLDRPDDIPEYRYNYSYMFPFETAFKPIESAQWMNDNWTQSILLSAIYLAIIYVGKKLMQNRPPFELKTPLVLWNGILAILSILGMVRFLPDFHHALVNYGFQMTVCVCSIHIGVAAYWSDFFAFSKALELTDTTFLILRKRPVVFLHWYHHVTVMIYTWHGFKDHTAAGRWFIMMNYSVHSVMYTYYTLRAAGLSFPRWVPMSITMFQLSQMVVGVGVTNATLYYKLTGVECRQLWENLALAFLMYFTYFLLFARLFYDSYFGAKRHKYESKPLAAGEVAQKNSSDRRDDQSDKKAVVDEPALHQNGIVRPRNGFRIIANGLSHGQEK